MPNDQQIDFFISYNQADRLWAVGIGNWLDQANFTTAMQSQDFVAGSNFVSEMNTALVQAKRVIAVISPDYFMAPYPESEWTAAFANDPTGSKRTLILVRIRECEIPPLLATRVYIDLTNMNQNTAKDHFLAEIKATLANVRMPKERRTRKGIASTPASQQASAIHQEIHGDGNIQSMNVFTTPPVIKKVIERRSGSLSSSECLQVKAWIEALAEGTVGIPRQQAYGKWWGHFKSALHVEKYEELPSVRMGEAERWYRMQRAKQTSGLKAKAPDEWRRERITAIKAAMGQLGVTKENYYPDLSRRLKMKKPFVSVKDLTKRDLQRVYNLVLGDARTI